MYQADQRQLSFTNAAKRVATIALSIVLCLVSISVMAEETGTLTAKVVMRKTADQDAKALQTIPQGDEVVLLDVSGSWYKVNYGKYTGYVMKKYVKTTQNSVVANAAKIDSLGSAPGALRIGNAGKDVTKLQKALDILGYYDSRIDGEYGESTTAAVMAYQKDKGLEADGVAGKGTITSIFGSCAKSASIDGAEEKPDTKASSSKSSSSGSSKAVSSLAEIGSAPSSSEQGDSGSKVVKLQQALEVLGYYSGTIDGDYGQKTVDAVKRFQKNRGMKQDGVAGSSTIRVLFGDTSVAKKSGSSSSSSSGSSSKSDDKTEVLDWYKDDVTKVIPKNARITIKDIRTGKTFKAVRWSGANHIDAEPATSSDTKTMKNIYGGSWSWNRRAILVQYNGHVYAASMNGMPHGDSTITNNDFAGVFCIHFKNSKTHGSSKVDPDHQKAINTASKASW